MSFIKDVVNKVTQGTAALFDKGKEIVAGKPLPLSYQKPKSTRVRVRYGDLARTAKEYRRFRDEVRKAARRNTRGLPFGMSLAVARRARSLEVRAMHGHLPETVGELEMQYADGALQKLKTNAASRKKLKRPSKIARRVLKARRTSCRPTIMAEQLRAARVLHA